MRREVHTARPKRSTEDPIYYQKPKAQWSEAAVKDWRASIPFTNEQFIACLQQIASETHPRSRVHWKATKWAAWIAQTGRISAEILHMTLPRLVTTCGVCRKPATRRYGCFGRCDRHAHLIPAELRDYVGRKNAVAADIGATKKLHDYLALGGAVGRPRANRGRGLVVLFDKDR